jgi:hypothetical protein
MSYPRAFFPVSVIEHYRTHGAVRTCRAYHTTWETLRRWLREHGVEIRPQGLRLGRQLRTTYTVQVSIQVPVAERYCARVTG